MPILQSHEFREYYNMIQAGAVLGCPQGSLRSLRPLRHRLHLCYNSGVGATPQNSSIGGLTMGNRGDGITPEERFWLKVNKNGPNGCWEWTGSKRDKTRGYGGHWDGTKGVRAHRFAWELHHGKVTTGLRVLHRCDNPGCVNPSHLFLGTDLANVQDRDEKGRQWHMKDTHCIHGHLYSEENTGTRIAYSGRKCRRCRECARAEARLYRRRHNVNRG